MYILNGGMPVYNRMCSLNIRAQKKQNTTRKKHINILNGRENIEKDLC